MEKLVIEGGRPLSGTMRIQGAKNAALPILAACVLAEGTFAIDNVPDLLDIRVMLDILRSLGCRAEHSEETVTLDMEPLHSSHIPEDLMKSMRSSIFLMGPLLARFGSVQVYQPGGCAIGERKINLHLQGLEALGARIEEKGSTIICTADKLVGAEIPLDFPSVGATENIMMAAATADGITTIHNAAREPEIQDLQNFLNAMGAKIFGAGTSTITIEGVSRLHACRYRIIPDRIVTGTMMVAAAVTRGSVTLERVCPAHLTSLIHVLKRAGVQISCSGDIMSVSCGARPKLVERIVTSPHPSFPTDLQSLIMVLLSLADGLSIIKETVFEGRFKHVDELSRMGADIRVDLNSAFIRGVPRLYGATVEATDLRAGAALVVAGLAAHGTTVVEQIHHIDRGYDRIEIMLNRLGASITRSRAVAESPQPT
ncbi:UDP-N-acetylglucosamine 1-carboxyvinyltransferase [Paenibacillus aurantius]|uniref:UDP-N-acetylglucosamine 1-carboxyvinyltransferase n=1 Tax=Paenibacillus aurantius TaxID=2918900 RepID=A0AA96LK17_9BACL|nr:UDP-N-acetylglucosamine 1-carboxyvinyltransferase [Paenibacillus aurantius]WNQ13520.1 UDP-N-acetylglucosamine 1-carboxyvinyltransferase [Paenibacillus aurantius]